MQIQQGSAMRSTLATKNAVPEAETDNNECTVMTPAVLIAQMKFQSLAAIDAIQKHNTKRQNNGCDVKQRTQDVKKRTQEARQGTRRECGAPAHAMELSRTHRWWPRSAP